MKSFLNILSAFLLFTIAISSCKKDENKVYLEGGTAPALVANVSNSIPLAYTSQNNEAVKLSWTNPEYHFNTGISSQDVNYLIEIDTAGANFSNPNKKTLSVSKDLEASFTQTQFNDYLLNQLVLVPGISHDVEIRVKAAIGSLSSAPLYSNVLKFSVTPYAIPPKVTPPASGRLFLVGNATPGGWNNPVPVPDQEFAKVSETMYEITVPMTGGNSYLLLPVNGSWDAKYGGMGADNTNNVNGDDFKPQGNNLLAPAASGTYKITVDFQRGKFTVSPQ